MPRRGSAVRLPRGRGARAGQGYAFHAAPPPAGRRRRAVRWVPGRDRRVGVRTGPAGGLCHLARRHHEGARCASAPTRGRCPSPTAWAAGIAPRSWRLTASRPCGRMRPCRPRSAGHVAGDAVCPRVSGRGPRRSAGRAEDCSPRLAAATNRASASLYRPGAGWRRRGGAWLRPSGCRVPALLL